MMAHTLPLDLLQPGEWADVAEVTGEPALVCRMAEIGIRSGCRLQVVQNGSPCLLNIDGCRLCLRMDDSAQIFVHPLEG